MTQPLLARRLVEGYARAGAIKRQADANKPGVLPDRWHETVRLPDGVTATIEAVGSLNPEVTVSYSAGATSYRLYQLRDYTTVVDLRRDGTSVYFMRQVQLATTEQRLVLFDLAHRRVTADRRVDMADAGDRRK